MSAVLLWGTLAFAVLVFVGLATGRGELQQAIPAAAAVGFALVGRLLTTRRPENATGWIIAAAGAVVAVTAVDNGYANVSPGDDPLIVLQVAGLITQLGWEQWLPFLLAIALPLLFPDGRLPSPRWRPVMWAGVAGAACGSLSTVIAPGPMDLVNDRSVANPLGIAGADGLDSALGAASLLLSVVGFIGAVVSVIVRLRRSHGVERQQLKWFAYVAVLMIGGFTLASVVSAGFDEDSQLVKILGPVGWFTALAAMGFGIPAATGIAVMRYRLYEIDVVIRRTLVYAALTATLAAAYIGTVLLLQLALDPVTSGSSLAVAVSTLAVAALFRPARTRIQGAVDRRFYRRSYDAARTLERFSARLREQVDLDALGGELRGVVRETMQPAHVSLWLREAGR